MLEKLAKAYKQAMGEARYNTWMEACDKLDSYKMTLEEYEKAVSGNFTLILDIKRAQIIFYDKDLNMTTVAYIDED